MEASYGPELSLSQVVVLLLGEKQSGKSSTGNTILGKLAFHKNTTQSSIENSTIFGTQVTVVDTPGWLSHSTVTDRVSREVCRGLSLCRPEPSVILLVVSLTSTFGQEELNAMEFQIRLLQTLIWQRAMVVFTHEDKLGGLSIQEHIRRQGRPLQWLLGRCLNRYHVMTNQSKATGAPIIELLVKINTMVEASRCPWESQQRMYTQMTQDLSIKEQTRWQGGQEETGTAVLNYDRPKERQQMALGWSNTPKGPVASRPPLGLILLGRSRSGKSLAGNTILNRKEFQIARKTLKCSVGQGQISGQSVTVVDTPGWSLFGLSDAKQVRTEICLSPVFCPMKNKVCFLLVVPVDSFKEKDRRAMEEHLSILGDGVWKSTVVLFTYGEELRGGSIENHIKKKGEPLQWVLDRCGHRYHVFSVDAGSDNKVDKLLQLVEQL